MFVFIANCSAMCFTSILYLKLNTNLFEGSDGAGKSSDRLLIILSSSISMYSLLRIWIWEFIFIKSVNSKGWPGENSFLDSTNLSKKYRRLGDNGLRKSFIFLLLMVIKIVNRLTPLPLPCSLRGCTSGKPQLAHSKRFAYGNFHFAGLDIIPKFAKRLVVFVIGSRFILVEQLSLNDFPFPLDERKHCF